MTTKSSIEIELPAAPAEIAADPLIGRIKTGLASIYGKRLAGIVLYGSRARRTARSDSDYDVIALLKDYNRKKDWSAELHRLADDLFQEGPPEIEVNILPMDERALRDETIFIHNVRADGVFL